MLKRIQSILGNIISSTSSHGHIDESVDVHFAVAILLVEVMHADHVLHDHEQEIVLKLLKQQYALNEAEAMDLFTRANKKMNDVVSLHRYTSMLNSKLLHEQKFKLVTNLWRVVLADGQVDKHEEHLVRRVADLIYLGHKGFIKAKHLAIESPIC